MQNHCEPTELFFRVCQAVTNCVCTGSHVYNLAQLKIYPEAYLPGEQVVRLHYIYGGDVHIS